MTHRGSTTPARPCRVLLVDDHAETLELLEMLLVRRGFAVTAARSIGAALAAAEAGDVDVLVSDLRLPDGDGCELLSRLRSAGKIPAIALSGLDRDADIQRARDAGFDEHLAKPVTIDVLAGAIRRLCA